MKTQQCALNTEIFLHTYEYNVCEPPTPVFSSGLKTQFGCPCMQFDKNWREEIKDISCYTFRQHFNGIKHTGTYLNERLLYSELNKTNLEVLGINMKVIINIYIPTCIIQNGGKPAILANFKSA